MRDGYSYSIMISALCRCGQIEEAKQLAGEFETKYDKYDVVILNTMLCAYSRSGEIENVMKMMKKMDESAISPDWNTFKILIKYFCKEQLYLLAYHTMEDTHSKGHQPQEFSVQSRTASPSPQLQLRHRDLVRDEVTFGLLTAMISRFCTSNSGCGSSLCSRCSMGSIGKYATSFSSNRARQHRNEVRFDDGWIGQRPQQKGHRQQYRFYPQGLRTTRYFHQDWVMIDYKVQMINKSMHEFYVHFHGPKTEKNTVPSLRKALKDIATEKVVDVVAREDLSAQLRTLNRRMKEAEEEQYRAEEDAAALRAELNSLQQQAMHNPSGGFMAI